MSKAKHTPGPWDHESKKGPHNAEGTVSSMGVFSVAKFNDLMDEEDADESDAIDGSWVCGIWGEISDEDQANARLIAAAPDLLEALKEFVHPHQSGRLTDRERDEKARAAIAKAEGRS